MTRPKYLIRLITMSTTTTSRLTESGVAKKLGQDPALVYKTLVTEGKSKEHYVFVIPVAEELNLKEAASSVSEKSVEMIHVKDINKITGYIRGGCSPDRNEKQFKTVIDSAAEALDKIVVKRR